MAKTTTLCLLSFKEGEIHPVTDANVPLHRGQMVAERLFKFFLTSPAPVDLAIVVWVDSVGTVHSASLPSGINNVVCTLIHGVSLYSDAFQIKAGRDWPDHEAMPGQPLLPRQDYDLDDLELIRMEMEDIERERSGQ